VATPSRASRNGGEKGAKRNTSALEELMRRKGVDEAWNALEEMQHNGNTTDKYTVSRMLMKTVGDGRARLNPTRVYRVISLVEKFIDMQPEDVDEVLLNALLDICCRLKDLNRLEGLMQRMRDLKITPSPVTLGILVKTYGQSGNIDKVLQVWDDMEKQRGQANAVTYGCMIDACVKCNRLDKAIDVFQGMRENGKHRNTIIYTTLIKGYGLEKDLASALALFREMPQEGVPYNTITYNSMLDACVKGGDLATAETLLQEITAPSSPLEPDLITFSTLVKGYCQMGDIDKALQITEAIKLRGLRCDELVYNTLMDGCVKANDVDAGVGLFEEMVHNGMRPSAITHSILARLYQRAGYEEDAADAVAQLYQHHGIERPAWGDRTKGAGRRGANQRSPGGRGGASPVGSPLFGFGHHQEQNENCWSMWSDSRSASIYDGYSAAPSCVSTPCGSPTQSVGNGSNSLFLPMDPGRGIPPLPGMGPDNTPHASSCAGLTPMNSAFQGSYASSPCMSPSAMDQHGQAQVQTYSNGPVVMAGSGVPSVPPFPFAGGVPSTNQMACTMPGLTAHGTAPGVDPQGAQFYPVQMAQPASAVLAAIMPSSNNMMIAPGPNGSMNGPCNTEAISCVQMGTMPSATFDNSHGMYQTHQQQGQSPLHAFFETYAAAPPDGQQGHTPTASPVHQSPFCL
jgi:pentatricopeptide repeat protein